MNPDKDRKPAREEFEVAYYTKELGRPLQRKLLQSRLDDFTDSHITAANHQDEEPPVNNDNVPPRDDRAG